MLNILLRTPKIRSDVGPAPANVTQERSPLTILAGAAAFLAVEATFLTGGMTISLFKSLRQHAYALGLGRPQQRFLVQFHRDHVRSYNAVDLHRGLSPLRGLDRPDRSQ
jgi:hypothetical protein